MKFYTFSIIGSFVFLFFNVYCYKSISKNSVIKPYKIVFLIIFATFYIFELIYFFSFGFYNINLFFYKAGIFCMGASFMVFSILAIYDFFNFIIFRFSKTRIRKSKNKGILNKIFSSFDDFCEKNFGSCRFSRSRRKALRFLLDIGILIGVIAYVFKGFYNANLALKITKRQVRIKNLKNPMKFAVISDIHIGEFLKKDFMKKIVANINQMKADAVCIVGDLVDLEADKLGDMIDPLLDIKSKFGTFFVSGNHEYYHGVDGILQKVKSLKVRVLDNESVEINGLNLVGVSDIAGFKLGFHEPNYNKALSNLNEDLPTILLTHQPKSINYIAQNLLDKLDLLICGHTHAGQIFPFGFFVWLDQKYTYGLYQITQKLQMLVTSGAGFWGPPMRILSKSEIVELELIGA